LLGGGGQSAPLCSSRVLHVRHEFFPVFCSIHFAGGFLVHEVWRMVSGLSTDDLCVADGPQVGGGRFVFRGALLEVRSAFSDSPHSPCGWSAPGSRTVRPPAGSPPLLGSIA
jgi:hypothetical protein